MGTSTSNAKSNAPALIVFGTPVGTKEPHAAWFRAEYAERAKLAAQRDGLTSLSVNSSDTRAAAQTLKEGQLKAGGQLAMPSISQETMARLRTLATNVPVTPGNPFSKTAPGVQAPVSVWDKLKPADLVLAAFLDKAGEPDGWYEATIMKIENGTFTVRWYYEPKSGFVRLQRQHIAIMFPG
jgi:hypothetical protein